MNHDYDKLNLGSMTIRLSVEMLKELDCKYGPGLKYRDRSDAVRGLVSLGLRVESLLEIQADPKKKQEFEEKFAALLKEKDVQKSLETMNPDQLRGISFFLEDLKNKKVQLLLEEIKAH